jgi:hypothetical protein
MLAPLHETEMLSSYVHSTKSKLNILSSLITKQTNKQTKHYYTRTPSMLKHIYGQDMGESDQNITTMFHHVYWQVFTLTLTEHGA